MEKLLRENALVYNWKKPQYAPLVMDCTWVRIWNFPDNFLQCDNSKRLERLNTRWLAPPPSWFKLNFDGVAHSGVATRGGVIRDNLGNLVLAYANNFGSSSSNMAEALALFWGLKLALTIAAKRVVIEEDSNLIIEATKGFLGIAG
ncbi:uncharacterized protein LOC131858684 [Cryptomeria japonica]|uniref:uncharacterized protein LOC131858684 n=1 Tax=Cryptomeria japonica TaxID=3369 RepID=UPI0027D9DC56|nr:uncharacterized protein LOC131858684 [Cryptomeria japonica]